MAVCALCSLRRQAISSYAIDYVGLRGPDILSRYVNIFSENGWVGKLLIGSYQMENDVPSINMAWENVRLKSVPDEI